MSEYLERETAINIADHAILEHPYDKDSRRPETYSDYNQGWSDACEHIRARLEYVPAADAAPVRHGKNITEMHFSDEIICSICGFDGVGFSSYDPVEDICIEYECRYCPNCGARMDGEEKG